MPDPAPSLALTNTVLALHRTRQAADRTLMAMLRTALSLIGFGFTIFTFFSRFVQEPILESPLISPGAPARFGLALVLIGVVMLVLGIFTHLKYLDELRRDWARLQEAGLVPGMGRYPVSMGLVSAVLLLVVGLFAVLSIIARAGPFG